MGKFLADLRYRLAYEIVYEPYYILCFVLALLWLGEGVAVQSGWAGSCPVAP